MFSQFLFLLLVSLQFPTCVPVGQCDSFAVSQSSVEHGLWEVVSPLPPVTWKQ